MDFDISTKEFRPRQDEIDLADLPDRRDRWPFEKARELLSRFMVVNLRLNGGPTRQNPVSLTEKEYRDNVAADIAYNAVRELEQWISFAAPDDADEIILDAVEMAADVLYPTELAPTKALDQKTTGFVR